MWLTCVPLDVRYISPPTRRLCNWHLSDSLQNKLWMDFDKFSETFDNSTKKKTDYILVICITVLTQELFKGIFNYCNHEEYWR